jgi:hypothetical protein
MPAEAAASRAVVFPPPVNVHIPPRRLLFRPLQVIIRHCLPLSTPLNFSPNTLREHPVGKSFNAVLFQIKRLQSLVRVTVFGVLPEQQHTHTVGNETYVNIFLPVTLFFALMKCCLQLCRPIQQTLR